jgi:hypothetical protein
VLQVLACDNPFPSAYMEALAFNQMVMKVIFNGLPLARILGLGERADAELRRMARAFARERRAAGRTVPRDLALIDPALTDSDRAISDGFLQEQIPAGRS